MTSLRALGERFSGLKDPVGQLAGLDGVLDGAGDDFVHPLCPVKEYWPFEHLI